MKKKVAILKWSELEPAATASGIYGVYEFQYSAKTALSIVTNTLRQNGWEIHSKSDGAAILHDNANSRQIILYITTTPLL